MLGLELDWMQGKRVDFFLSHNFIRVTKRILESKKKHLKENV